MKIIGLSGGIASGKNFLAEIFAKNGAAIFDADKEVHKLLESDKSTFDEVLKKFPQAIINKKIDRKILGKIVFADEKKLKILEKILHPQVRKKYQEFLKIAEKEKREIVVLNVPLLLESEVYKCDKILAIITSKALQKQRFLEREKEKNPQVFSAEKKSLEKKFAQIRSKQISNLERKRKADFIINGSAAKAEIIKQIKKIIEEI